MFEYNGDDDDDQDDNGDNYDDPGPPQRIWIFLGHPAAE